MFSFSTIAATLTPHRAFYEMRLGTANQNSVVQAISGRSAFTLDRDCNGWRSNENYIIELRNKKGELDRVLSRVESWESNNGEMYSFDVNELSSFQKGKNFSGYAEIKPTGGGAYFSMEDGARIELPVDTHFPILHMKSILDSAENGKTILAASVFLGAKPDDSLLATNTVIGVWKNEVAGDNMGELGQDGYWPIQTAYFKPTSPTAMPEYEIHYSMQRNGIVRRYVIDYGDFTIIADLLKLEAASDQIRCQ
ncbi:cell envelope integrity EipB family protein [Candidatus Puniceispirillum sp.]|nr:cell envelope integrity EipB family protein [Candidatus Puniceispirillum sp.]